MAMRTKTKGNLFVISAPSGAGKSTVCQRVLREMEGIAFSISHTTRSPRKGEVNGKDYYFISTEGFQHMIQANAFIEWAQVHGNLYGTSYAAVEGLLTEGMDVILDVDVQGKQNISRIFPDATSIFILPPSLEVLEQRLRNRATDDESTIAMRLKNAITEIQQAITYDFIIINNELEVAVEDLKAVIRSKRCATRRVLSNIPVILQQVATTGRLNETRT